MIKLTDRASVKLEKLIKAEDSRIGIRAAVRGGGCSGFQYVLEMVKEKSEKDRIIEDKNVKIFVDPKSYLYLMGTEIDWVDELNQSGFKFINPNAKRTCGCGESFSV